MISIDSLSQENNRILPSKYNHPIIRPTLLYLAKDGCSIPWNIKDNSILEGIKSSAGFLDDSKEKCYDLSSYIELNSEQVDFSENDFIIHTFHDQIIGRLQSSSSSSSKHCLNLRSHILNVGGNFGVSHQQNGNPISKLFQKEYEEEKKEENPKKESGSPVIPILSTENFVNEIIEFIENQILPFYLKISKKPSSSLSSSSPSRQIRCIFMLGSGYIHELLLIRTAMTLIQLLTLGSLCGKDKSPTSITLESTLEVTKVLFDSLKYLLPFSNQINPEIKEINAIEIIESKLQEEKELLHEEQIKMDSFCVKRNVDLYTATLIHEIDAESRIQLEEFCKEKDICLSQESSSYWQQIRDRKKLFEAQLVGDFGYWFDSLPMCCEKINAYLNSCFHYMLENKDKDKFPSFLTFYINETSHITKNDEIKRLPCSCDNSFAGSVPPHSNELIYLMRLPKNPKCPSYLHSIFSYFLLSTLCPQFLEDRRKRRFSSNLQQEEKEGEILIEEGNQNITTTDSSSSCGSSLPSLPSSSFVSDPIPTTSINNSLEFTFNVPLNTNINDNLINTEENIIESIDNFTHSDSLESINNPFINTNNMPIIPSTFAPNVASTNTTSIVPTLPSTFSSGFSSQNYFSSSNQGNTPSLNSWNSIRKNKNNKTPQTPKAPLLPPASGFVNPHYQMNTNFIISSQPLQYSQSQQEAKITRSRGRPRKNALTTPKKSSFSGYNTPNSMISPLSYIPAIVISSRCESTPNNSKYVSINNNTSVDHSLFTTQNNNNNNTNVTQPTIIQPNYSACEQNNNSFDPFHSSDSSSFSSSFSEEEMKRVQIAAYNATNASNLSFLSYSESKQQQQEQQPQSIQPQVHQLQQSIKKLQPQPSELSQLPQQLTSDQEQANKLSSNFQYPSSSHLNSSLNFFDSSLSSSFSTLYSSPNLSNNNYDLMDTEYNVTRLLPTEDPEIQAEENTLVHNYSQLCADYPDLKKQNEEYILENKRFKTQNEEYSVENKRLKENVQNLEQKFNLASEEVKQLKNENESLKRKISCLEI